MNQPAQTQAPPGVEKLLSPQADHGEKSYQGCAKLQDKVALITGGDSGIGRAICIAYAREGADIVLSYLNEHEDAKETARWITQAERQSVLIPGDIASAEHCRAIVTQTIEKFGRIDILVNNAAHQRSYSALEDITDEAWRYTFNVNLDAMFYLCKAALPYLQPGSSIINTSSVNSDFPKPTLLPYAATKAAIANFTASLAQLVVKRGIRVNCVAPGPIWTPLIPATLPPENVEHFGSQVPLHRPGQPAEVAPVFVFLASMQASYVTGARYAVTGGVPI